jgi:transcription elongation factor Elf1
MLEEGSSGLPRQPWVFKCPVCEFDHVRVYSAKEGRSAYVVCGRCRSMKIFDLAPKMGQPIDLYNDYCDAMRSRMGSHVEIPFEPESRAKSGALTQPFAVKPKEAGGSVIIAVPLCDHHEFVIGEPIRGFQGEMLAQTRICLRCGHAERDQV